MVAQLHHQIVDLLLLREDGAGQLLVRVPVQEVVDGLVDDFQHPVSHVSKLGQRGVREGGRVPAEFAVFQDVFRVVAHPLQVVDHVEQVAHHPAVLLGQVHGVDFDQVAGDVVVEVVHDLLILLDELLRLLVGGEEGQHRQLEIVAGDVGHPLHLLDHLGHRDGRGAQNALVQKMEPHLLIFRILAGDQLLGQLDQQLGEGEHDDGGDDVEADVGVGNLHLRIIGQPHDEFRIMKQQTDGDEQDGADDVEHQVHHGRPLAGPVGADGGEHGRGAGADVLAEEDEDDARQGDRAAGGQGLDDAHRGGGGLDDRREHRARQDSQHRVGELDHQLAERRHLPQGHHGAGHALHAGEQDAEAHDDHAQMLQEFLLDEHHEDHADKNQHRRDGVDFQPDEEAGHRGANVGPHDDIHRLLELKQPGVEEADHHDGGGRGGLDGPGDHHAHQNAQQWVGGDFLQQPLEAGARHQLQAVAHQLHAEQEHPQPAEQGQHMRIVQANTPLCLPPRRQKPSDLGSKNSLKL